MDSDHKVLVVSLFFLTDHPSCITAMLVDSICKQVVEVNQQQIISIGISPDSLLVLEREQAFRLLPQQILCSLANRFCSPMSHGVIPDNGIAAVYLTDLESPQDCRGFVFA